MWRVTFVSTWRIDVSLSLSFQANLGVVTDEEARYTLGPGIEPGGEEPQPRVVSVENYAEFQTSQNVLETKIFKQGENTLHN